jgi:nucleosome assembly protein 1-like 1
MKYSLIRLILIILLGIPEFWLIALKNNQIIEGGITDKDAEALKSLTDVKVEYIDATKFQLNFHFAENAYFTNTVLSKTFTYQESPITGAHIPFQAEGTTIEWKEGQNLTVEVKSKKQRHKETNKTRVVKKTVPADTFFNFFATRKISEDDEEEDEDVYDFLELDFEIGEEIKDKIVPHAIDWFTGKASELEGLEYGDDEEVSLIIIINGKY